MSLLVRNLIIGKKNYVESWYTYKQVMLSGQYALIAILLAVFYAILEFAWEAPRYENILIFLGAAGIMSISIYLHRKGEHCAANYFLFPTMNLLVYLFAASEDAGTGVVALFIPVAVGAFAVFDFKQRLIAIFFAVFSYVLFMLAFFGGYSPLPRRQYNEDELLLNLIINFTVALPASITAVYLLTRLSHYNAMQLVESNKLLTKTNQELDRFVYSTSHDLRAPMASMLGLVDLANRRDNDPETGRYLVMIKDRIQVLDRFVKDITDYSRNNRIPVERAPLNLADMVLEIWEGLRFAPEARRIRFEVTIPHGVFVVTDPTRLRIVLTNLISNAIRYHDPRKEQPYIGVHYRTVGLSFCIQVEDNGVGIEPAYHKRVFDMFFRGSEASTGSGLGLYIVKETCLKLSGSVQFHSEPNTGSIFTVKLPVLEAVNS
jgi:signal transduction histidine kinase